MIVVWTCKQPGMVAQHHNPDIEVSELKHLGSCNG